MKVLVWVDTFLPQIGGMEIQTATLVTALQARGHEIKIISGYYPGAPAVSDYAGATLYRFPFSTLLQKRDLRAIAAVCAKIGQIKRQFAPDILHIHSGFFEAGFFFYLQTKAVQPTPTLLTVHGLKRTDLSPQSVLGRVVRESDWVVGVSDSTVMTVRDLVPEIGERSSRIYNALPWPTLTPTPLNFNPPHLLGFGRLMEEKGFDLAITAMLELRQRFSGLRLVIAGDGPARPNLEAQVQALGLVGQVEFLGWVAPEAIPALINTATIVVMPSRWSEPFGLVALQAAQMARPIVAARIGGLPEVVVAGETGLLFEPGNTEALVEAVAELLQEPERARALGTAARLRAQTQFSLEVCVKEYEALYQRLVGQAHN